MQWKAQWIWIQGEERPRNFYLYFRKTFTVPGQVTAAVAYCTADSRYMLFVNGRYLGRGPARSVPLWQSYDRYNLTPYLKKGKNVISAVVHHCGEGTYSYIPVRGGFLFQLEGRTMTGKTFGVRSDRSWEVRRADTWNPRSPRMEWGFCEEYDARREPEGWRGLELSGEGWERAVVVGPAEAGPWGHLEPRGIPMPMELFLRPRAVLAVGRCIPPEERSFSFDLGRRFPVQDAVAYLATYLWSKGKQEVFLSLGSSGGMKVWVDGEEVLSYHRHGRAEPGQHRVRIFLEEGWHTLLLKSDHSAGEWRVYFEVEGEVAFSAVRDLGCGPYWRAIGPFENEMVGDECVGFSTPYPPERNWDLDMVCQGKGGEVRWAPWESVAERMAREEIEPLELSEGPKALVEGGELILAPGEPTCLVLDFGREVVGYPRISLDAPEGTVVDIGYGDALEGGRVVPDRADRYIAREGVQEWETFGLREFRYLQLIFRKAERPIRVGEVGVNFSTYPVRDLGSFRCSDELLRDIWDVGRYTVQLCMHDAYEDGPRTRAQRWGEVRTGALVNYYAFGDHKLIARGLRQIARSQREDGMVAGIYPTEFPERWVPNFAMLWAVSLWEYALYSGDLELVRELYPCVERLLEGMARYEGDRGLLEDVPGTSEDLGPETLNMAYAGALKAASEMARLLGSEDGYARYIGRWHALRTACFMHLYDEERKTYADRPVGNLLAAYFGIVPAEERASLVRRVLEEARGVGPYQLSYGVEVLFQVGEGEFALELIRRYWGGMLKAGATTWWEDWEGKGARCYGGASGPTYILSAEVLGIRPSEPGWRKFRVQPRPADLEWAEGEVPTPMGVLSVSWRREGESFHLCLEAPFGATAEVGLPAWGPYARLLWNGTVVWEPGRPLPQRRVARVWEEDGYLRCTLELEGKESFSVEG